MAWLPLTSPPKDEKLTANEALAFSAMQLFVIRIASAGYGDRFSDEDVHTVSEMCRQLDGIALAIELAAGRAAAHGIGETAALLNSQFALLWPGRRTAPARQQTLNATLDWSYELLSDAERAVLRRLSVFAGSFTLDAARRVADGDLGTEEVVQAVGGLLAKFFLSTATSDLATRYRLLDTTRAYASRKLEEAGEREAVRRNHALYYCEFLQAPAANEIDAVRSAASATDLDDIQSALRWAFDEGGEALIGADIAAYSAPLWLGRALLTECRAWMAKAAAACIDMNGATTQQQLRIQIAFASAELFTSGFTRETVAAWERTLERAKGLSDLPAQFLSYTALWAGEIREARYSNALKTAESCAAVARGTSDAGHLAFGEWLLGHSKHHVARFDEAQDHLRRSLEIDTEAARFAYLRATGYDRHVDALCVMSNTLWILGYPDQARAWSERAVSEAQSLGIGISISLAMLWALLNALLLEPDADVVEHSAVELLELSRAHAIGSDTGFALCVMGLSQANRGEFGAGVRLAAEGLRMLASAKMEAFSALVLAHICEAALAADRLNDAQFWMAELETTDHNRDHWCSSEILRVRGLLADAQGDRDVALEYLANAVALARQQGALSWELRSTLSLGTVWVGQQRYAEALDALQAVYARFEEGYGSSDLLKAKRLINELRTRSDGRSS